jgi:hypothetical protein
MVDAAGALHFVEREGRLNPVRHESVLFALNTRANRFRSSIANVSSNSQQQQQLSRYSRIDETGTVPLTGFLEQPDGDVGTQVLEELEARAVSEEILQVHGKAPGPKQDGTFRILYENANGIDCRQMDGYKVRKAREIHDKLEVDLVAYNEHRINYQHRDNSLSFNQLFRGGEAELRSIVAHNSHENVRRVQEGGTSLMLFGPLVQQLNTLEPGKDETGLGRWVVMTLTGGTAGFTTRIVCGYNPCGNSRLDSSTTYAQHRRYFLHRGCLECPRVKFRQDLVAQLIQWREQGDRLVVCLDANEDIYKKSLGKTLTNMEGLAMKEVVGTYTGQKLGATYFRGSKPIDGIWATSDVTVTSACMMPVGFGIGDHRLFVVDLLTESLIGNTPTRILRPCARRLTTKLPGVVHAYNTRLEGLVLEHRIIERMGEAHKCSLSNDIAVERMNRIDDDFKCYMLHAEVHCRKIKSGRIPFSPESEVWIRRRQAYIALLKVNKGGSANRGNLKRATRRCGIMNPFRLTENELLSRLQVCNDHCEYYRDHGHLYRRRHLQKRAMIAKEEGNEDGATQILNMITRERQREFWRRMRHSMGQQSGRSVQSVQVAESGGGITEHTTQNGIENAIWTNIHQRRFFLAEDAPICQGDLRREFGYLANTEAAHAVLHGEYTPSHPINPATADIFAEVARTRSIIPRNYISDLVTAGDWGRHWTRGVREETSSSESGLHFGHQIAGAHSPLLSHAHATQYSFSSPKV